MSLTERQEGLSPAQDGAEDDRGIGGGGGWPWESGAAWRERGREERKMRRRRRGREGGVCVARRWAFKTRAVSGARLSLPSSLNLPGYLTLPGLAYLACYQGYVHCFGSSARQWPVHGVKSAAQPGRASEVCGLRRSQFSTWRKERAWALSQQRCRCSVGHPHPAAAAAAA